MSDPRHELPMHEAQHSFDVVLRGYDRSQVADTIERLEADFRIALADRDAAVARTADLAGQLSAMHGEIESLRRKAATASAPTFENISERIQHMLQLAEEEAGEIRRAAELDAQAVREQTDAEERALLERHAAGQAEVERMMAEARQGAEQIMQKAQLRADELVAKAQERVARLDAESQARRAKVEEDFDIAQRARRAEFARAEEERERVSTQAARQRVAAAEQHAAALVADAEAKAEAIRGVRDELTSRLVQARRLLDGLPDLGDRAEQPAPLRRRAHRAGPTGDDRHRARPGRGRPGARAAPAAHAAARPQPAAAGPQTAVQPAVTASQAAADQAQPARRRRPPVRAPPPPAATPRPAPPVSRPGQTDRSPGSCRCRPARTRHRPAPPPFRPAAPRPRNRPARRAGSFLTEDLRRRGLRAARPSRWSACSASLLALVGGVPAAHAADEPGRLRIAHLSPDSPPVDVALTPAPSGGPAADPGTDVARALGYGDVGDYRELAPGSYAVSVRPAGTSPTTPPALSLRVEIPAGGRPHARTRRRLRRPRPAAPHRRPHRAGRRDGPRAGPRRGGRRADRGRDRRGRPRAGRGTPLRRSVRLHRRPGRTGPGAADQRRPGHHRAGGPGGRVGGEPAGARLPRRRR